MPIRRILGEACDPGPVVDLLGDGGEFDGAVGWVQADVADGGVALVVRAAFHCVTVRRCVDHAHRDHLPLSGSRWYVGWPAKSLDERGYSGLIPGNPKEHVR